MDERAKKLAEALMSNPELWHNIYLLCAGFLILIFFKNTIEEIVSGFLWRFRKDFNEDDIIRLRRTNGFEWGRIQKIGITRTKFTIWEFEGANITKGYTRFISNSELRHYDIDKPLNMVALPENLQGSLHSGANISGDR